MRRSEYVEGAPLFVDAEGDNMHLREGSPVIDRGSSDAAPSSDIDGDTRPQGQGYDIGADEYVPYPSPTRTRAATPLWSIVVPLVL